MSLLNPVIQADLHYITDSDLIDWHVFANKRVLVTGASGLLPAYMVETLLYLNRRFGLNVTVTALVRSYDNFARRFASYLDDNHLQVLVQDVTEPVVLSQPHHFIIHAASNASPKYFGQDPVGTIKANVMGTMQLLDLARQHPVEAFLYFSSGEVCGSGSQIPTGESDYGYLDPTDVRSCYAESKRIGENMCACWYQQFQVPTKIVRPSHTFGPGMRLDDGRVFSDFVASIVQHQPLLIKSDGKASRAFCYVSDATIGYFLAMVKGEGGTPYNVGNDLAEYSVNALADMLVDTFADEQVSIHRQHQHTISSYLPSPFSRCCPEISRIKALGWRPQVSVAQGFQRTVSSFRWEQEQH